MSVFPITSVEEGALAAFEDDCEALLQRRFPVQLVRKVSARSGDDGVDMYVGAIGVEPINVCQCKFFLKVLGNSPTAQIRQSFTWTMTSDQYQVKSWGLCVPLIEQSLSENKWWAAWQHEQELHYQIPVRLLDGRELIRQFKARTTCYRFQTNRLVYLAELHQAVNQQS